MSNLRRKAQNIRPTLTPRHSEKTLLSDSNSSSERLSTGRFSGIVRWFKGSTSKDINSSNMDHVGVLGPELAATFMRHGSLKGRRSADGIGKSLQKAKRRVERRLGRFGKGKKKSNGAEEAIGSCKLGWDAFIGICRQVTVSLCFQILVVAVPMTWAMGVASQRWSC